MDQPQPTGPCAGWTVSMASSWMTPRGRTWDVAANLDPDDPPPQDLLDALAGLRDALIDRLQGLGKKGAGRAIHADVIDLCGEVVDALTERARTLPAGVEMAVDGWLEALEQDPDGLRDTIAHYSMVLAATCQQSVGKDMVELRLGKPWSFAASSSMRQRVPTPWTC